MYLEDTNLVRFIHHISGRFCELGHEYCHIAKVDNPPPCHNGGTCVSLRDDFICMCVPGYTGKGICLKTYTNQGSYAVIKSHKSDK